MKYISLLSLWNSFICGLGNLEWLDAISCTRTKTRVTHSLTLTHAVWIKTFSCSMLCFYLTHKRKPHLSTNKFNGKAPFSKHSWILGHEYISNHLQLYMCENNHKSTQLQLVTHLPGMGGKKKKSRHDKYFYFLKYNTVSQIKRRKITPDGSSSLKTSVNKTQIVKNSSNTLNLR